MRCLLIGFLSLFLVAGWVDTSKALNIDVEALPTTIFVGDTFELDLEADGFGNLMFPTLAQYEISIEVGTLLNILAVSFAGGLGAGSSLNAVFPTASSVIITEVTALADAALTAEQPDSFVLATLKLKAVAIGSETSFFSTIISATCLTDTICPEFTANPERVYSVLESPVPEPTTFLLLASGLAGLGFFRMRRKDRKNPINT